MSGFLLQLGGPLQSWGEHSDFTDRDTVSHPTRSGLIGMIASAFGISRDQAVADWEDGSAPPTGFGRLTRLRFTIRCDRPGTRLRDFHTVGGGYPAHRTVPTAKGGRRGAGMTTIVSHRGYLSDAVFTVAVTAPNAADLAAECAQALAAPRWPLHMGRRSCPPGALFLLRADVPDPVRELRAVPLARSRPGPVRPGDDEPGEPVESPATVTVRFTADTPFPPDFVNGLPAGVVADSPAPTSGRSSVSTLNDEPVRLMSRDRVYRSRPAYATSCRLPADLCAGHGLAYLDALDSYLHPSQPERNAP
ncbi:type I-E CRISPR-associated protein Cas5/CasD [Streptomyces odonnellii]|uniref:type I-E CRISPR-associated protein Cas5/CasD n=1 Tax=Streptomyces odonnellii TaxID=1417980 RepID=UPI00062542AD|nr:type I-E CRISPR-associated protein Cas5/CasD [Streptomyces odonnellii]